MAYPCAVINTCADDVVSLAFTSLLAILVFRPTATTDIIMASFGKYAPLPRPFVKPNATPGKYVIVCRNNICDYYFAFLTCFGEKADNLPYTNSSQVKQCVT